MNVKKVLKVLLVIFGIAVVGCVGLVLYDNFVPSRAKKEEVEFCECLKEYKTTLKCGRYGHSSSQSSMAYLSESVDLFGMSNNSAAHKKYQEMRLQWALCQKRVSGCRLCDIDFW